MVGRLFSPHFSRLWVWLRGYGDSYGVTRLSYQLILGLTFVLTLGLMSMQMVIAGAIIFVLHFVTLAVLDFPRKDIQDKDAKALHIYGFCALTIYALVFGMREDFGMPVAFLFLSWIILSLTNISKVDRPQLIGGFEAGTAVVLISLFPDYIPATAILCAIICFLSAGITIMMGFKK